MSVFVCVIQVEQRRWDLSGNQPVDQNQMEGELAYLTGARGGKRSERVCSREERKRRKTSGVVEEGPSSHQRHPDSSSVSGVSRGIPFHLKCCHCYWFRPRCRGWLKKKLYLVTAESVDVGLPLFTCCYVMTVWMICCVQLCCDLISLISAIKARTEDVKAFFFL